MFPNFQMEVNEIKRKSKRKTDAKKDERSGK